MASSYYTNPEFTRHDATIIGSGGSVLMEYLDGWTTEHFDKAYVWTRFDHFASCGNPNQVFTYRYAHYKSAEKAWVMWETAEVYAISRGASFHVQIICGPFTLAAEWSVAMLGRILRARGLQWSNANEASEAMHTDLAQWTVGSGDDLLCKGHPKTCAAALKALLAAQFSHQMEKGEVVDFLPAADYVYLKDRDVRCVMNTYTSYVTLPVHYLFLGGTVGFASADEPPFM
jgi:hypothetical protein